MGPESSSKPSTTCFPSCATYLPTASITAPTCARPLPNLATGQSRSSRAPPGLLGFDSSRADGLSSEPSPGSIEIADWLRTSRPQFTSATTWIYIAATQLLIKETGGRIVRPMRF